MYHGFRLFIANTRLAWVYSNKLRAGQTLTRRERLLLESATMDLLRLVPFSFFVIVPFAELLLPVALKMFPGLIPSTFETQDQGRNKAFGVAMTTLLARQRLTEYMTTTILVESPQYSDILRRANTGDTIEKRHIKAVAHLCGRGGPLCLQRLPDPILACLAKTIGVYHPYYRFLPYRYSSPRLRQAIVRFYRKMKADDNMLDAEGIDSLTEKELIKANEMRGMRWTESKETLAVQLTWWVALAHDPDVPYNALFWLKPTRRPLRKAMEDLPLTQRRQLLGIQNLPPNVREGLEQLCSTIDRKPSKELDYSEPISRDADELARKIEDIYKTAAKSISDLDVQNSVEVLGRYLTRGNIKTVFEEIRLEKPPGKPVTVSDVVDHLGPDVGLSSHIISNLFDAFDFQSGNKEITEGALLSIGERLRDAGHALRAEKKARLHTEAGSGTTAEK
jgi:LETM1 and EF-hand domain-containing protein 1